MARNRFTLDTPFRPLALSLLSPLVWPVETSEGGISQVEKQTTLTDYIARFEPVCASDSDTECRGRRRHPRD
jgi:hypothetical protein